MSHTVKTATPQPVVAELYAYYRAARDFGDTPDMLEMQIVHDSRRLAGACISEHTLKSFDKAYQLGDRTWTALNEVDRRYKLATKGRVPVNQGDVL